MTLRYFQKLSENKQYRELLGRGVCIGERRSEERQVLLFQVDHFYAEIFFHAHTDEITEARSFENTDELDPYLQQINIDALLA